jgi:hypothetical protein
MMELEIAELLLSDAFQQKQQTNSDVNPMGFLLCPFYQILHNVRPKCNPCVFLALHDGLEQTVPGMEIA